MSDEAQPPPPTPEDVAFQALVDSLEKRTKTTSIPLKFIKWVENALMVELPSKNFKHNTLALSEHELVG